MRRIKWTSGLSAVLLLAKAFTPLFHNVEWVTLVALIAVAQFVINLNMIDHPITQFIQQRDSTLQEELNTKIKMVHRARGKGNAAIQVFVNNGWVTGTIADMSESRGVLLLKVDNQLSEMVFLKDMVRVRTSKKTLGILLGGAEETEVHESSTLIERPGTAPEPIH